MLYFKPSHGEEEKEHLDNEGEKKEGRYLDIRLLRQDASPAFLADLWINERYFFPPSLSVRHARIWLSILEQTRDAGVVLGRKRNLKTAARLLFGRKKKIASCAFHFGCVVLCIMPTLSSWSFVTGFFRGNLHMRMWDWHELLGCGFVTVCAYCGTLFCCNLKKKERERFLFFFLPSPAKTWIGCSKRILLFVFVCVTPLFFSRKNKKSGVGGKWHSPLVQLDGYRCRTKPDSATRSGRVKGQVRFGVGGCAERPG